MNFLASKLKNLPETSGVYLMKDVSGNVIYVGKAINLKRRVSSYFQSNKSHNQKTKILVSKIEDFEILLTSNENEALILECNLIKKYSPEYNILLKDDKTYPYIEITNDKYPRLGISRKRKLKTHLFGPYTSAHYLKYFLSTVRKFFHIRTCKDKNPKRVRPCLYGFIGLCSAPCAEKISYEEYMSDVKKAINFLNGNISEVVDKLYKEIKEESDKLNFEKCSVLLKSLRAIEDLKNKQKVIFDKNVNRDYIGFSKSEKDILFKILIVRDGALIDRGEYIFSLKFEESDSENLKAFLLFYYENIYFMPSEIYVPCQPEDVDSLENYFSTSFDKKISILSNLRGKNKEFVELACQNAEISLKEKKLEKNRRSKISILEEIKEVLGLAKLPNRIETYDISNLEGAYAVGSMVVFTEGVPDKKEYRKFKIKCKDTPDDFAMMREMIFRRFCESEKLKNVLPDLVVIDGGKGQISAVEDIIKSVGVPFIGLAKKNEEIYFPDKSDPLILDKDSNALNLIRYGRDEAHRFAITFHRHLRSSGFISKK